MRAVKPMNKAFIAKLLVLCMIVSLLPTIALAAPANGNSTYKITADVSVGGKVSITYEIGSDSQTGTYVIDADTTAQNLTYEVSTDTLKVTKITVTPKSGYEFFSGTYSVGNDTNSCR